MRVRFIFTCCGKVMVRVIFTPIVEGRRGRVVLRLFSSAVVERGVGFRDRNCFFTCVVDIGGPAKRKELKDYKMQKSMQTQKFLKIRRFRTVPSPVPKLAAPMPTPGC